MALVLVLVSLAIPAAAEANAGIPMIMLLWPGAWLLFFPIVLLEGQVAKRVFAVPWSQALSLSWRANLWSTLAGIPGAWLALLVVEFVAGGLASLVPQAYQNSWLVYLLAPFMAPWFPIWRPEDSWMVPAAAMWLCVGFFFASVWLERRVLARQPSLDAAAVRRWSWQANLLSYGMIELLLAGVLVWDIAS
jgi:hypothetical protein